MFMILVSISLLAAGGILCLFLTRKIGVIVLASFQALAFAAILPISLNVLMSGGCQTRVFDTSMFGPFIFSLDPLSAFFVFIISFFGFLASIYMNGSLKSYEQKGHSTKFHMAFFSFFIASMETIVICHNAIMFLAAWELMSFLSFFLIVFENDKPEVFRAGIQYLVTMQAGSFLLIGAFLFLYSKTGSPCFQDWTGMLSSGDQTSLLLFWVLFAGFGIKAGFFPLHSWLPHAHPAAPSHISSVMSGVMIKIGIYGILRLISWYPHLPIWIGIMVITVSLISALWGVLHALGQHDLKRLLAFHSIENIGIIGLGIGFGILGKTVGNLPMSTLGFMGAILHVFNHALFKSLLFLSAGSVYQITHTKNIERLGGLIKIMPGTAAGFLIGAAAISGLPPLNGFLSEFIIFMAMLKGLHPFHILNGFVCLLGITGLALTGALAIACFAKAFSLIFLGNPRSDSVPEQRSEAPISMLIPMFILSIICFIPTFFPLIILQLFRSVIIMFSNDSLPATISDQVLLPLVRMSITAWVFIGIFLILIILRRLLIRMNGSSRGKIWSCGFQATNPRMQYTASSFARSILSLFGPFIGYRIREAPIKNIFNKESPFVTAGTDDMVETRSVHPLFQSLKKHLGWFRWIQSGRIQDYLTYGIVFLLLCIVIAIFR